jgi:hypothetical protein
LNSIHDSEKKVRSLKDHPRGRQLSTAWNPEPVLKVYEPGTRDHQITPKLMEDQLHINRGIILSDSALRFWKEDNLCKVSVMIMMCCLANCSVLISHTPVYLTSYLSALFCSLKWNCHQMKQISGHWWLCNFRKI